MTSVFAINVCSYAIMSNHLTSWPLVYYSMRQIYHLIITCFYLSWLNVNFIVGKATKDIGRFGFFHQLTKLQIILITSYFIQLGKISLSVSFHKNSFNSSITILTNQKKTCESVTGLLISTYGSFHGESNSIPTQRTTGLILSNSSLEEVLLFS